ncbi:MAG: pyridoxamine 5'-phosphate oxidase family protein [Candidatus Omnitrophica bacterium]|nr:pyridoxamine 5'-phosphate oxidase family protein [Candidatus Omnitrophota bacterium]MDD5429737.1 pyridoxamine 5'-phosphate oxidase family protein [Candidatus Omnitrophota bacterium]
MIKKLAVLLKGLEFIDIASCDLNGQPNAAPKFLLKSRKNLIYIVDCVMGRTWENLKINPRVSLPVMDAESLMGYRINGDAQIVSPGPEYDSLIEELSRKQVDLSVKRVISGIHKERIHKDFELSFPREPGILKIIVKEIVEIGPTGKISRQQP